MSQEEIAEYCREFTKYDFAKSGIVVNNGITIPGQVQPLWSSEINNIFFDYHNPKTSATHCYLTAYSIFVLVLSFHGDNLNLTEDELYTIFKYSEMPDRTGPFHLYASHFYDPQTDRNYLNSKIDTAKTAFVNHYNDAVKALNNGKREKAIQELGQALHFIQDVCEPHHSNNKISTQNNHGKFESWVADNIENIDMNSNSNNDFDTVNQLSPEELLIAAAWSSKGELNNASNETTFQQAAELSVGNAVLYTTLALYHFTSKYKI